MKLHKNANRITLSICAALFAQVCFAFSGGSPFCTVDTATMNSNMGLRPDSPMNPTGWSLETNALTYSPGGSAFGVRLANTTNATFKGVLLWATDSAGNQVGSWASAGTDYRVMAQCDNKSLTHTSSTPKNSPSPYFQLSLPINVRGQITIRAFVVKESRDTHYEMTSTHVHLDPVRDDLDIDSSVSQSRYQATTDGMLVLRYLIGVTGSSLTSGVKSMSAIRTDAEITTQLNYLRTNGFLDVDGDGQTRPETDGLLILRYLLGYRQGALLQGVNAGNLSATQIEAKIAALLP